MKYGKDVFSILLLSTFAIKIWIWSDLHKFNWICAFYISQISRVIGMEVGNPLVSLRLTPRPTECLWRQFKFKFDRICTNSIEFVHFIFHKFPESLAGRLGTPWSVLDWNIEKTSFRFYYCQLLPSKFKFDRICTNSIEFVHFIFHKFPESLTGRFGTPWSVLDWHRAPLRVRGQYLLNPDHAPLRCQASTYTLHF